MFIGRLCISFYAEEYGLSRKAHGACVELEMGEQLQPGELQHSARASLVAAKVV